jgi:predicted nucleic acid-binding protein
MKTKAIYLDVCALSRPFDDQRQMRIRLETVAVEMILSLVKAGRLELMASPAHAKEIGAISDVVERTELQLLLACYAKPVQADSSAVRARAEALVGIGFGVADAAHVAFAEFAGAYFISCDDRLIKLCCKHIVNIESGNPISFCEQRGRV